MEDYYRISFKYGKILKGLQEILQTLESQEEQQEEKEEVCSQSNREHLNKLSRSSHSSMNLRIPSPTPNAGKRICTRWRNKYGYPRYPTSWSATDKTEQVTLSTRRSHDSVWVPARGPSRCRLFTKTDNESQSIIDPSLRSHLRKEEQKIVAQASSSQTMIREMGHHEDSVSKAGETTRNDTASKEEHDYAEVFQNMIAIPPGCS